MAPTGPQDVERRLALSSWPPLKAGAAVGGKSAWTQKLNHNSNSPHEKMHVAENSYWQTDHHQVNSGANIDVYTGGASGDYGMAQAHKSFEDEASLSVVQLRGLPYRATVQDIIGFLGPHASNLRDGAKSVQLVPNHKGRPSGFAKLYLNSPKAAAACRDELHLRNLEDRYVEVFLCSDWPDRKQGARQRSRVGKQELHNMSYNGENYNGENIPHVAPQLVHEVKKELPPMRENCSPTNVSRGQRIDMDVAHIKNKVKNTFLEFGDKDKDSHYESRRTRSDITSDRQLLMSPEHDVPRSPFPIRDNYILNGRNESPDRNGNHEPAYLIPMTPSPLIHSNASPSDVIIPPFGYCGDGMLLDDGGLPPSFEEMELYGLDGNAVENPYLDYLSQGQFFPDMYCDNFVPDGTGMQGWDATGMEGVTLPDGSCPAGDSAWDAPPTLDDVDMSNNWENFVVNQDCASGSSKRDSSSDRWADSMNGHNGRCKVEQFESGMSKRSNDGESNGEELGQSRDRRAAEQQGQVHSADVGGSSMKPENYTTVMLRNIPNKYTREMLVKVLNQSYKGHYDFMYLPIDFKNKCNVGYGFVNFCTSEACQRFIKQFDGVDVRQCLPGINSKKVAEVTPARQQGLTENVRRLRNSPVMNQLIDHPEWMPLILDKNGNAESFPLPDQTVPPIKPRGKPQSDKLCN